MPHKPGPKTELGGTPVSPKSLSADEMTWRRLKVLGGGNYSRGLRLAARYAYLHRNRDPEIKAAIGAMPENVNDKE